jgi:hypothetical protein
MTEKPDFGVHLATYRRTLPLNVLALVLIGGPCALTLMAVRAALLGTVGGGLLSVHMRWYLGLGGAALSAYLVLQMVQILCAFDLALHLYEHGFHQLVRARDRFVRWEELEAVYRLSDTRLRWALGDGRAVSVGPLPPAALLAALSSMASASEPYVWARMQAALAHGERAAFGPLSVDRNGLDVAGRHFDFAKLRITVSDAVLEARPGAGRPCFVSIRKVTNPHLLLRALAAVAPQTVPWYVEHAERCARDHTS